MKISFLLITMLFVQRMEAQNVMQIDSIKAGIENRISLPKIPDYEVNVTRYGAKGDGMYDCKRAFDKAIKALSRKNGGTITVPKGIYNVNGPIHFISNMQLNLEDGAIIRFGDDSKDYPMVLTSWEGTMLYNHSPMIYGMNVENVAIAGTGTIDGEGSKTWSEWKSLENKSKHLSRDMNHNQVPVKERIFGNGHFLRPQLIQFVNSRRILIENVTIEDAPFWCVHLLKSSNIVLRGLKYDAHNKNNDGIDIEHSQDVLIENIDFDNGDDNIAIKAGRDDDGRLNHQMPSENVIIRNCRFKGLHALVIGSEMSAGVKNIFVDDCQASGYLKRGIYIKTNSDRGGFIKNIYFNNLQFKDVEDAIYITANYHGEGGGLHPSKVSNIHMSNLQFDNVSNTAIVIEGFPTLKVEDVFIKAITIKSAKNGLTISNTKNVLFDEIVIGVRQGVPSAVH